SCLHAHTTWIHTLPLHDALPIFINPTQTVHLMRGSSAPMYTVRRPPPDNPPQPTLFLSTSSRAHKMSSATRSSAKNTPGHVVPRSEEHTSELQSRENLVCRLLLE